MPNRIEPTVHFVAETMLTDIETYLTAIGNPAWKYKSDDNILLASDAEILVEAGGRMCYRSWEPWNPANPIGTNKNVAKVRTGNQEYISNILKSGHGSVLEHASISFIVDGCSRVFTHEQVRHRAGVAYSQESLRYVRLTELSYYLPKCIEENPEARMLFAEAFAQAELYQQKLETIFAKDLEPSAPFHRKKELTSAFRRIAPDGLATAIMVTANIRALRHMIAMRTSEGAEEEIRLVYGQIADYVKERYPNFFQDMIVDDKGVATFDNHKV